VRTAGPRAEALRCRKDALAPGPTHAPLAGLSLARLPPYSPREAIAVNPAGENYFRFLSTTYQTPLTILNASASRVGAASDNLTGLTASSRPRNAWKSWWDGSRQRARQCTMASRATAVQSASERIAQEPRTLTLIQ
jgi:hypothetical protein